MGTILTIFAVLLCLIIAYTFFVILQLALFNLIMLVVMIVWLYKICRACKAVISRILDSGRKKPFKQYVRTLKNLAFLKELNIEIQENDEGKWLEIHLNEAADDKMLEDEEDDN